MAIQGNLATFQHYSSGIYSDLSCTKANITHVVTVVGYGSMGVGQDYYIIKNSWGYLFRFYFERKIRKLAFINKKIRNLLKKKAITIWLDASIHEILHRIGNKRNRPLLNGGNYRLVLEKLIKERSPIYAEADFKFDTSVLNYEIIIKEIIEIVELYDR